MNCPTSRVSPPMHTPMNTVKSLWSGQQHRSSWSIWRAFARWLASGTRHLRADSGIARTVSGLGSTASPGVMSVSAAAKASRPCTMVRSDTAPRAAVTARGTRLTSDLVATSGSVHLNPASASSAAISSSPSGAPSGRCAPPPVGTVITYAKSVRLTGRTEPVYNITVEGEHVYFANGVLTHNCDAMAWIGQMLALLVRPREQKPPPKKSWKDKLNKIARGHSGRRHHMAS